MAEQRPGYGPNQGQYERQFVRRAPPRPRPHPQQREGPPNIQNVTLMNWRTNKSMLEVKLFEGESFFGTLEWFDQYTLGFKGWSKSAEQTTSQMILIPKHAVIYMREHKQPPSGLT